MWIYDKKEDVQNKIKNYLDMSRFPEIRGYDFEKEFEADEFFKSYLNMGFQGSNFGIASNILKEIIKNKEESKLKNEDFKIFISFTGNMISSGNREIIKFLVKNKYIDCISTTAAGIEEDIIKSIKPFHLGTFEIKGEKLLDECIGRIGNIFVPADRYLYLERFLNTTFPNIMNSINEGKNLCTQDITMLIGKQIESDELTKDKKEESFLYWAYKNNIPVFCPGINDGAIGDISVFFRQKNKNFIIDISQDNERLTNILLNTDKAASIVLGGGISKHFLLNAAIFRDGFDYSIYISTAESYDGSDSGGNQEEAISWAKIKPNALRVKINADATLIFPLLIASIIVDKKITN